MAARSERASGTHLVEDAAHPVKENLEEVALEKRQVQVALLERFGVPPPVPPLAHAAIIPELQGTNHRRHINSVSGDDDTKTTTQQTNVFNPVARCPFSALCSEDLRAHESHLSVCISEVGVIAGAFHVVRRLGLVGNQTQEAATSFQQ